MSTRDLLRECRERRVLLRNDAGALLVKPLAGTLPEDLRTRLVAAKQDVLRELRTPAPKCPGCGVSMGKPVSCYSCRSATDMSPWKFRERAITRQDGERAA